MTEFITFRIQYNIFEMKIQKQNYRNTEKKKIENGFFRIREENIWFVTESSLILLSPYFIVFPVGCCFFYIYVDIYCR